MTKYRVVVNAGQTWKNSYGDEYRGLAERCVHLEARDTEDAVQKALAGDAGYLSRGKRIRFLQRRKRAGRS